MPDPLVALGFVVIGVLLAVALYGIMRMAASDELDARGIYGTKGRRPK